MARCVAGTRNDTGASIATRSGLVTRPGDDITRQGFPTLDWQDAAAVAVADSLGTVRATVYKRLQEAQEKSSGS
jgi:hypothetical protein